MNLKPRRSFLSGIVAAACAPFVRKAEAAERSFALNVMDCSGRNDFRWPLEWQTLPPGLTLQVESFYGKDERHEYRFSTENIRIVLRDIGHVREIPGYTREEMLENIRTRAYWVRENLEHWCGEVVRHYRGEKTSFPIESSEARIRKHASVLRELIHRAPRFPRDRGFCGEVNIYDSEGYQVGVELDELLRALAARGIDMATR